MTTTKYAVCALALSLSPAAALAHAAWIAQQSGDYAVIFGEGSSTNEAYDAAKVSEPRAWDKAGAVLNAGLVTNAKGSAFAPVENAAVLSATFSHGWWTEDATGEWHNEPADAYPGFKGTGQYLDYAVTYLSGLDTAGKALGIPLEIVPLADPTVLSAGDVLEVQVLADGQPLEGAGVALDILSDWEVMAPPTDAEGKTRVKIVNNGLNVLNVYLETEVADNEILGRSANLSFVAGGPEEEE
jgi:uncharacterized GH25 family protein